MIDLHFRISKVFGYINNYLVLVGDNGYIESAVTRL